MSQRSFLEWDARHCLGEEVEAVDFAVGLVILRCSKNLDRFASRVLLRLVSRFGRRTVVELPRTGGLSVKPPSS